MTKKIILFIALILVAIISIISICAYAETVDEDLVLEKKVTQEVDEDGNYKIVLDAYTTGAVLTESVPVDVILVLDVSASMEYTFDFRETDDETKTKMYSMKQSVNAFLTALNENAKENGITHRVSIVSFSDDGTKVTGDSFIEIDGTESVDEIIDLVDAMTTSGSTKPETAMELAKEIYDSDQNKEGRSQFLILFSDGVPDTDVDDTTSPDEAIALAKTFKDDGVTVYSVGIFRDADPEQITFSDDGSAEVGAYWSLENSNYASVGNRFMNFFSSNSPDAEDLGAAIVKEYITVYCEITNASYQWSDAGYYLVADDADKLNTIFENLSQEIVISSSSLDGTTQVRDYISEYFTLPEDFSAEDIILKVLPYEGGESWGTAVKFSYVETVNGVAEFQSSKMDYSLFVEYDEDVGSIIVYGFDFDENVVTTDSSGNASGNKLRITFNITRAENFIGGNDVPTNLPSSGIYSEGELIGNFDVPNTQVELIYDFETEDQIIYRGNSIEFDKILNIATAYLGTANAFVDITFHIYNSDGSEIGTVTIPRGTSVLNVEEKLNSILEIEDSIYKIECIVTPNAAEEDSISELNIVESSLIYVLQPEVLGCDLWVDYGTSVNLLDDATTELTWTGNALEGIYHSSEEDPPMVSIIYNDVGINDMVVESNLEFQIDKLLIKSSDGVSTTQINVDTAINIYLNEYGIDITKYVTKEDFLENPQDFLFEIEQNGNVIEVIMPSDGFAEYDDETLYCIKKVSGLYAGLDSVVTESIAWSWRYALDCSEEAVTVTYHNNPKISYTKVSDGEVVAQFTNQLMISNWLSDEQSVINKFAGN